MSVGFYRAFEDEHRGSRDVIKERQRVYLPFIQPLKELYPNSEAIDLGCGRGEWLELLNETGFHAQGVDLDDGMLAVCRERGLKVQTKDAIAGLEECADQSQSVVSGFHLAEHIPFDVLQTLVSESLRVLKPGGILILETPNPENIVVGTANFYLDPTHKQPIPPLLLSFLAEHLGFARVKVIRLQAPVDLTVGRKLSIHDVLGGVSPDYAIVAQKSASEDILRQLSCAFTPEYGVTLGMLAGGYDQQIDVKFADTFAAANAATVNANAASLAANFATADANAALSAAERAAVLAEQAMAKAIYAENALNAIYVSTSWRITAPVRWAGTQVKLLRERGLKGRLRDLAKKVCRPLLVYAINYFDAHPDLRARYSGTAGKVKLYDYLCALYLRITVVDHLNVDVVEITDSPYSPYSPVLISTKPTPLAQHIHHELKAALVKKRASK
jgi:SAM-dependent methyltransferase